MALFNIPQRATRDTDNAIALKSKTKTKSVATVKGGNDLLSKISAINAMVEKNLGQFKDDYIIIRDAETFNKYIDTCITDNVISIDTETTGLDPIQDKIVGVCLYSPNNKPAYVPINHINYITNERLANQLTEAEVHDCMIKLEHTKIPVIMFNAKFDIRFMRNQLNIYLDCFWDCYLAARLLNENEGAGNNGLKALHKKYVLKGEGDAFSFDALFSGIRFDNIPITTGYLYAAHDAIITYELYLYQRRFLDFGQECCDRHLLDVAHVFHDIEMPCVSVVCDMEDIGVKFDFNYNAELKEKYHKLLDEKRDLVYTECAKYEKEIAEYRALNPNNKLEDPINIGSPSQLATLFYDILKVGVIDNKTPRGTGEAILQKIDLPICKAILDYREMDKLVNTYIDKLPACVNPKDGRIHCSYNQYGADTGRFSSNEPNLQNIPSHNKDIRKMFIASDGYVLMSSDYSQQEPKVMTQMCQDPKMIQAYKDGKDLYAEIASLAFNKPYEECLEFRPDGTTNKEGKNRRTQAKSILLGVLYGRGVPSIAEQLKCTPEKAQQIKDSVFKGFPAIPQFEADSLAMAKTAGYVTTLWGRKRRLPDIRLPEFEFKYINASKNDDVLNFESEVDDTVPLNVQRQWIDKIRKAGFKNKRRVFEEANAHNIWIIDNGAKIAQAERQTVNARIQGSAADMSKLAMIKVGKDEQLKQWGFRLLIPVHDELIAECPEEHLVECRDRFAQLMSEAAMSKLEIPISCDVEVTKAWYGESIE